MTPPLGKRVWVFHAGALGDHVMIWPLVRALARQGAAVTVVASSSHAHLCEREIGRRCGESAGSVRGIGAEHPRFTRMWIGSASEVEHIEKDVASVVSFITDEASEPGRRWLASARALFPGASVECVGLPRSAIREAMWTRAGVERFGGVALCANPRCPITLFAGAGGRPKRWPIERWAALAGKLRGGSQALQAQLLTGPVEAEQWSGTERAAFERAGGVVLGLDGDIAPLADAIRGSRLFIGGDTGPTHLAAQLGVPTIALFGPTDSAIWSPVGPCVRVLAPETPLAMDWLSVDRVLTELESVAAAPTWFTSAG